MKFDWSAALPGVAQVMHRVRVRRAHSGACTPSFEQLATQQARYHAVPASGLVYSYVDDESDECTVTSNEEWNIALGVHAQRDESATLKFRVDAAEDATRTPQRWYGALRGSGVGMAAALVVCLAAAVGIG